MAERKTFAQIEAEQAARREQKRAEKAAKKTAKWEALPPEKRAKIEARAAKRETLTSNPIASFGGYRLASKTLTNGLSTYALEGATAEATTGAPSQRSTLTRMGAGALLAGPAGFIVGAVARKDTTKSYVTVTLPTGVIIIEGPAKDHAQALHLAAGINASAT